AARLSPLRGAAARAARHRRSRHPRRTRRHADDGGRRLPDRRGAARGSRSRRPPGAQRIRRRRRAPGLRRDARRPPPGRPRRGDGLGADAEHEADLGADARALPALRSRPRPGGARGPLGRRRRRGGARAPARRMAGRRASARGRDGGAGVRGAVAGARLSGLRPLTRHEGSILVPDLLDVDARGFQHYVSTAERKSRVVVFGGSVAFGGYASAISATYFHVLGTELERLSTPADITIVAGGAWKAIQEADALYAYGAQLEPDLIVFLDGLNDLTNGAT